jgi:peptide/nickel transport system permease protein
MPRFLFGRIGLALPTLLLVSLAAFSLIRLIPGDPAVVMLGDRATPAAVHALREQLALDRPLAIQFLHWLTGVLHGDLGYSIRTRDPVLPLILERLAVSAQIVIPAVILAAVISVPAGTLAAWRQDGKADFAVVAVATLMMSIPSFWLGLLILLGFGLDLHWLPVVGYVSIAADWKAGLLYLVMPVMTIVLHESGAVIRMVRASTLDVLRLDYVTHARAKGLSETRVLARHIMRNAFGPTWTLLGLILGNLLGGIAVVETVFTIPGLGRLMVESIFARDYPVIQGCLLLIATAYVLINLTVDLFYPFFDPRVARS